METEVFNWIQTIGVGLTVLLDGAMVAIAIISAKYAYKAYKHQRDRGKVAAACELAKYYADVIIEGYRSVFFVLDAAGIDDLIKKTISADDISKFDERELQRILKGKKLSVCEFENRIAQLDPHIVLDVKKLCARTIEERQKVQEYITWFNSLDTDEKRQETLVIIHEFKAEIANLENQLEWFCMNCLHNLADETLIYQSLHQTFLSMVLMLYPFISAQNKRTEDKLFTNVIGLYNRWAARLAEAKKHMEAAIEKAEEETPAQPVSVLE